MGRPGTSGGGRRFGGGHSSGRSSGGHRVGRSRPTGSRSRSGGFSSGPSYHVHRSYRSYGGGFHGSPIRSYYGGGHGGGCLSSIVCCVLFILIIAMAGLSMMKENDSSSAAVSTRNRVKLENMIPYQNDCVTDELGYIEDVSRLSRQLQSFYDTTGIQPYLYLKSYDAALTTDEEKELWAQDWYEENIDNETTFLYVYFGESDPDTVGYMAYVNGKSVTSVMDAEAVDIFWNYLDRYWVDDNLSMTDVFIKTFDATAETIMTKTTTFADVMKIVMMIFLVIIVGVCVGILFRMKFRRDKEKAAETERILNTPLEKASDDLKDKYL